MKQTITYFTLLCVFHIFLLLKSTFTAWPELLTYPWLIEQGYSFYGDIIHPYLPLLPYTLLGVYKLFGLSVGTLKFFSIGVLIIVDILIFLISIKVLKNKRVLLPVILFIPLSVILEGNGLWFDLASIPFILGAIYLLSISKKSPFVLISGLLIGLAILVKHTNIIYIVLGTLMLKKLLIKNIIFIFSSLMPIFVVYFSYLVTPKLSYFLYWGMIYPIFVLPRSPGFVLAPTLKQLGLSLFIFLPLLLVNKMNYLFTLLAFISLVFAIPRFALFHLIPAAVFLSLTFGENKKYAQLMILYFLGIIFLLVYTMNTHKAGTRFFEPEVLEVRQQLTQSLPTNEQIFFLNVPSQYFVMTPLLPTKPWVDAFSWYYENKNVQMRVLVALGKTNYILIGTPTIGEKYGLGSYVPTYISSYIYENFTPTATPATSMTLYARK